MAGTVTGTFDLNVPAHRKLRELRREGAATDRTMERLGRTLDTVGGPVAQRRLAAYRRELRGLRTDAAATQRGVSSSMRRMRRDIERDAAGGMAALSALRHELRSLGHEQTRVHVDVAGISSALAQVELLHRRVRALGRERATPRVGLGGGGMAGGSVAARAAMGGGGRVGGGGAFIGTSGFGIATSRARILAAAAGAALPVVQSLGGALVALGGSAGAAAVGLGAVGGAGLTALVAGLGGIAAVAIPATKRIQEAYKAQTTFTDATKDSVAGAETQRASLERNRAATDSLTSAQRQAKQAQEDLTRARASARRELVDLALAADRGRLSERRARLELRSARREQERVSLDPLASEDDRATARLNVQDAVLGVRESRINRRRSVADARRARRGGVEGTQGVVQARQARAEARRGVRDAQTQVRSAAREMAAGSTTIATARMKMDQAFAEAPEGTRALIREAREFGKTWREETASAQRAYVGFLRDSIATGRALMPDLAGLSNRATGALRREGRAGGRFLRRRRTKQFVGTAGAMFDENLTPVRRTAENVADTIMNVTRAARPFLLDATRFIANWTKGWATSTNDISSTRDRIREYVTHFRAWRRLLGASWGVLKAIFSGAAPEGRSMVGQLTEWMDRQERWLRRNPRQVRDFFRRTVKSTGEMARALVKIVKALSDIATTLTPVLDRFSQLVTLAGAMGMLTPGAAALAFGALRGGRGRGARGAAAAGGGRGGAAAVAGGVGMAGAARGGASNYRYLRQGGLGRREAARMTLGEGRGVKGVARGAMRGGARAFAPVALALGALDFASFDGNVAGRTQNALSGATLGLVPRPQARDALRDQGAARVNPMRTSGALAKQRSGVLSRTYGDGGFLGLGSKYSFAGEAGLREQAKAGNSHAVKALAEYEKLTAAIKDARREEKAFRRDRAARLDEKSRGKVPGILGEFEEGFGRRKKKRGPEAAMRETVSGVLGQMRHMRKAGARELAQGTLEWAREQAKGNPKMQREVARLTRGIEGRFRGLHGNVRVIQGQILDGSRSQWRDISGAISSAARRGVDKTSDEFKRLRTLALNALEQMGMSRREGRLILQGGKRGRKASRQLAATGNSYEAGITLGTRAGPAAPGTGDGTGDGPGAARRNRGSAGPGLMGANAGLSGYASEGSGFGLHVSSGLRPGAITSSGNPSLHGMGAAIDEAGPPTSMLAYARQMAAKHGSGLDELIHTPLGFGIKNGKRVPLSYWGPTVNADHFDHVHVGDKTPGGGGALGAAAMLAGGGGLAAQIQSRASKLGGVPGALSTGAGAGYATALNAKLASVGGGGGGDLSGFSGGGSAAANRALGRQMMLAYGFGPDQWKSLDALWTGESNWDHLVKNASSGATGIPQSLPGSKMASAGADWATNPATQIKWGLGYIGGRYGTPAEALSAWQARNPHWYGKGGQFTTRRPTLYGAGDGQPSGGSEEVTVRRIKPGARGGLGGSPIHVAITTGDVTITSGHELKDILGAAADHAAERLLAVLNGDSVPDSALTGG